MEVAHVLHRVAAVVRLDGWLHQTDLVVVVQRAHLSPTASAS